MKSSNIKGLDTNSLSKDFPTLEENIQVIVNVILNTTQRSQHLTPQSQIPGDLWNLPQSGHKLQSRCLAPSS